MIRQASPKLAAYAALSAAGLLGALVTGRPELVALTAPFVVALGFGLALSVTPRITAALEVGDERVIEGHEVPARLVLESETSVD